MRVATHIAAHLRAGLQPRAADANLAPSLRAGVAVGVPLLIAVVYGWDDWIAYLALGSLVSLYGKNAPYRERAVLLAGTGVALTAAVVIGALAFGFSNDYLRVAVVAGVAGLAKLGWTRLPPVLPEASSSRSARQRRHLSTHLRRWRRWFVPAPSAQRGVGWCV